MNNDKTLKSPLFRCIPYKAHIVGMEAIEQDYLKELSTILKVPEDKIKDLHDRFNRNYQEMLQCARAGYSYNTIVDMFYREAFEQFKSDVLFPKYKISGGTIKGSLKEPEFNFEIERI